MKLVMIIINRHFDGNVSQKLLVLIFAKYSITVGIPAFILYSFYSLLWMAV